MRKFPFCFFILVLSAAVLEAQVLKINVKKGQQYLVETSTNMSTSSDIAGQSFQTNLENKKFNVYEVVTTGKNETVFQVTTTRIISKSVISGIMEEQLTTDSDTDQEDSLSKLQSKIIGKPKKIVIDNNGYMVKQDNDEKIYIDNDGNLIIKQDTSEKYERPMSGWDLTTFKSPVELFFPLFIGKEFKPGASFPCLDSFIVEKNTISFSLFKEKLDIRNSGTYTITGIQNGIAGISYTGTKVSSMPMNTKSRPMNSISKSRVRTELQLDINTGMVMSAITEEETNTYFDNIDKPPTLTSKQTHTIKVRLLQ